MRSCDFQRGFSGMNRRDFLFGAAAAAAASAMSPLARAQEAATRAKLDRISLLTNDFYGLLPETWGDWNKQPAPLKMNMLDLPDEVADRLHLHNLEVCNINLLSMEPSYIGEFKQRLHKAKSRVVDLIVELDPPATSYQGHISVCSPDPAIRAHAIELTKKWIDIAAVLGSPSVMPNQGVRYLPQDLTPCIEGLKALVDYGKPKGVAVILEPRGRAAGAVGGADKRQRSLLQSPDRNRRGAAAFVSARAHRPARQRQPEVQPPNRDQAFEGAGLQRLVLDRDGRRS